MSRIVKVTITGADDSVKVSDLFQISQQYPFVEWAILISAGSSPDGKPRYPSQNWITQFCEQVPANVHKSLHVCGKWVRSLLMGSNEIPNIHKHFERIQLNFHAEKNQCNPLAFLEAVQSLGPKQIIFQIDGVYGNKHLSALYSELAHFPRSGVQTDLVPLFDISGGAGQLPDAWPKPIYSPNVLHGYAGGLGPDNVANEIPLILAASAACKNIWIDMETHVRSADDSKLDLDKVKKVLEIASSYIK